MGSNYYLGIDLGGTKIMAGIIDENGKLIGTPVKTLTHASGDAESILERIISTIRTVIKDSGLKQREIKAIGVGSPGPIDREKGIILTPPNLQSLHNYPIKTKLEEVLDIKIAINNDANCFVLGETLFGAGTNCSIVFGVTLGTGFGSGIVMNNEIYNGATGTASEIWYFHYGKGIIQDYVSGKGVQDTYYRLSGTHLEPPEILKKAKKNYLFAVTTWNEFGKHLGIALSYVVNVLDPCVIIIGGSLSNAFDFFIGSLKENLTKHIHEKPSHYLKIKLAELGEFAGVIGAASLGIEK